MQEIEIDSSIDLKELESSGFNLEIENNSEKSRVGFYISKRIAYNRKSDLEGINSNMVILDIEANRPLRLINIYRSFNPQNNVNQKDKFVYQLTLIRSAMTANTIVMGDFNLDAKMNNGMDYNRKVPLKL